MGDSPREGASPCERAVPQKSPVHELIGTPSTALWAPSHCTWGAPTTRDSEEMQSALNPFRPGSTRNNFPDFNLAMKSGTTDRVRIYIYCRASPPPLGPLADRLI